MATLTDELRDRLEEEILTGALRPGDRLEETVLAGRYGVSRTPIREALLQLNAAGLIEYRPRRGAAVVELGPQRLMEMFEVMADLEAMCARFAARRITGEELAGLRAALAACMDAAQSSDCDAYYYQNEAFHARIRSTSKNGFLIEQADMLQKRLKPYRRMQLRARGRIRASLAEHVTIVEAIEAGAAERAAEAMRQHVTVQGERFTDLLASLPSATG